MGQGLCQVMGRAPPAQALQGLGSESRKASRDRAAGAEPGRRVRSSLPCAGSRAAIVRHFKLIYYTCSVLYVLQ